MESIESGIVAESGVIPENVTEIRPKVSYTARLSAHDHFSSKGERLQSAAEIIRQDRANYHVYGLRDSEDDPDPLFSDPSKRAWLEELLKNSRSPQEALDKIVNGTPIIEVGVYEAAIIVTFPISDF